jgi:hypothetical protein
MANMVPNGDRVFSEIMVKHSWQLINRSTKTWKVSVRANDFVGSGRPGGRRDSYNCLPHFK